MGSVQSCCKSNEQEAEPNIEVESKGHDAEPYKASAPSVSGDESDSPKKQQYTRQNSSWEEGTSRIENSFLPSTRPTGIHLPEIGTEAAIAKLDEAVSGTIEVIRQNNGGKPLAVLHEAYSPVLKDNEVYLGGLDTNFKRQGYGILYSSNYLFEGEWEEDELDGKGMIIKDNFEVYKGHFDKGELVSGTLEKADGYSYKGTFDRDLTQSGKGKERRPDGSVYIGEFKAGFKHGQGKQTFKDNSVFEGTFTEGSRTKGTMEFSNGAKYYGTFVKNLMHGLGKLMNIDGTVYEGQFMANKKHGDGKLLKSNGTIIIGTWVEDKLQSEKFLQDTIGRTRLSIR
mmetsp:Transcript_4760/g.8892  ORF Transcript_4760/g.8892 Transcript_4760/m.8892 type:complete len:340 (-) Transcript_4760:1280-2299(-)